MSGSAIVLGVYRSNGFVRIIESIKNYQFFQKQTPEKKGTGGKGTKEIKEKKNEIGVKIICLFILTVYFAKRYIYCQRKKPLYNVYFIEREP